jgi:hypothetical protein
MQHGTEVNRVLFLADFGGSPHAGRRFLVTLLWDSCAPAPVSPEVKRWLLWMENLRLKGTLLFSFALSKDF